MLWHTYMYWLLSYVYFATCDCIVLHLDLVQVKRLLTILSPSIDISGGPPSPLHLINIFPSPYLSPSDGLICIFPWLPSVTFHDGQQHCLQMSNFVWLSKFWKTRYVPLLYYCLIFVKKTNLHCSKRSK